MTNFQSSYKALLFEKSLPSEILDSIMVEISPFKQKFSSSTFKIKVMLGRKLFLILLTITVNILSYLNI